VASETAKQYETMYDKLLPNSEFHFKLGNAEYLKNNIKESLIHFDNALKLNIDFELAWYNKGVVLVNQKRHLEAIECYYKATQINPKNEKIWYNLGLALGEIEKKQEAIHCYEEAIKINPNYEKAVYNKAIELEKLGKYDDSIKNYIITTNLNSKNGNAWYGLASIYSMKNDILNSLSYLKKSIAVDKTIMKMALNDHHFDNIRDDPRFIELVTEG
jgi:tetratricopeptide (TPR) repeat protein